MSTAVAPGASMAGLHPASPSDDSNRLTLNLNSNNPFRNRAASPTSPPLLTPPAHDPTRARMSNNPFLDAAEAQNGKAAVPTANRAVNVPSDIFNDLSLLDKPTGLQPVKGIPPHGAQPGRAPPGSKGSMPPPRGLPRGPPSPNRPDAERMRRPRGMSETSRADKDRQDRRDRERERSDQPPRTESEERRRRERRKEREERHRREKEKAGKGRTRKAHGLDIIDKLDVTGIYGQGLFHHDGPFDACNPHRNAKRDRRAPMQAFPANSANMQLGGSGPINTQIDLDRFHGRGAEAFDAFNTTGRADTLIIDPTARTEAIHGDETYGLGTSTFLEGAPASKKDIQRQDSDDRQNDLGGGLGRKKSLAQKFRGMSSGRANRPMDLRSPETRYNNDVFDASPPPIMPAGNSVSAGGRARATSTKDAEWNPFDRDYENAYEKKSAQILVAEREQSTGRARAPSSPQGNSRGLVRTVTSGSNDGTRPTSNEGEASKTGFLSRMKSLKGGKRARPERTESSGGIS